MTKTTNQVHTTLGDLIAALYDQAQKITRVKSVQTIIVTVALFDLRKKLTKKPGPGLLRGVRKAA